MFIPDLTPIAPLFSPTNSLPIDLYLRLLFLYNILMFEYQLWFLSLTTWPCLDSNKILLWTSRKPLSLQRSSFILDLYAPFSLDYTPVLDLLLNSQTTSDTSGNPQSPWNAPEILRHEYKVVRCSAQAEANVWTPLSSRLSSAVHWTTL